MAIGLSVVIGCNAGTRLHLDRNGKYMPQDTANWHHGTLGHPYA